MTSATDRRAVLGAALAAEAAVSTAAIPAVGKPALGENADYQRALDLWNRWMKQHQLFKSLANDSTATQEALDAELEALNDLEDDLHNEMCASVHALAAVLMIENRNGREDVDGLYCASLAAIRPQLSGAIAEEADRVLAEEEESA